MQIFLQIFNTFVRQGIIIVLPRELGLDVAARGERLHGFDDLEVGYFHVGVVSSIVVLLGDKDTIFEEVLVDGATMLLRDEHIRGKKSKTVKRD